MNYAGLVVLVVATVAGICSCQKCTLPTNEDIRDVIIDIFRADDSSSTPTVTVMRIYPVCLALDDVQDRYRAVSMLVEYTCSGHTGCPSGTVVEQIESECRNGEWSNRVLGTTEFTRSPTTEANFSTTTENCAFCVSPELDDADSRDLSPDNVTHCVACDSSCSEGLMGCTGRGSDDCCNFYNNSMCVDECLSPFQPNIVNECVCPPGTTGHNCTEDVDCGDLTNPENGEVIFSATTYDSVANYTCDPGYNLVGNDMRRCLNSGLWSGAEPTCTIINCGSLDKPENGAVSVTTTTFNSVATYTCDSGYGLVGVNTRICLESGIWSGVEPTCTKCSVNNCMQCNNDGKDCEKCQGNYVIDDNECKCRISDCEVCDTDAMICDTCSKEGATFDMQQSECIVGDDGGDDGGGPNVGAIIGIILAVIVLLILATLLTVAIIYLVYNREKLFLHKKDLEAGPSTDHFNPLYVKPEELDDVDKGGVPAQSDEVSPTQDAEQTEATPTEESTDQTD